MRIDVNLSDIILGERLQPTQCPVAMACIRSAIGIEFVGAETIRIRDANGTIREIRTPEAVGERISAFDFTGKMEPFSFEIDAEPLPQPEIPKAEKLTPAEVEAFA